MRSSARPADLGRSDEGGLITRALRRANGSHARGQGPASSASAAPYAGAQQRRGTAEPRAKSVLGISRGARLLLLTLLSVGVMHVVFMLGIEGLRYFRAQADITRLESEVGALEAEAAQLQTIILHADDERYREQLARRQGYMYPDEGRVVTNEPLPAPGELP